MLREGCENRELAGMDLNYENLESLADFEEILESVRKGVEEIEDDVERNLIQSPCGPPVSGSGEDVGSELPAGKLSLRSIKNYFSQHKGICIRRARNFPHSKCFKLTMY